MNGMSGNGYAFATICSSNVNRSMEAHDLFEVDLCRIRYYQIEEWSEGQLFWNWKRNQDPWFDH